MSDRAIRLGVKPLVFAASLAPLAWLVWAALSGRLSANPLSDITNGTGIWTVRFVCLTLAITPLRWITGWNRLVKFRRMAGLYAFFYGTLHFLTYVVVDRFAGLDFPNGIVSSTTAVALAKSVGEDVYKRPFITIGFTAWLMMLPLAITSTAGWIRRLGGRNWNRLHKLVYATGALAVLHYWWLVRSDVRRPVAYATVVLVLLAFRAQKLRVNRVKRAAIAFSLFFAVAATAHAAPADPHPIDVAVTAPSIVSDALVNDIFAEADAIWAQADVTFQWRRSSKTQANRDDSLVLMFERSAERSEAEAPLGWITFESGRPGHTIHLAPANAESLIKRTPTAYDRTLSQHEALLSRAMGRAFAHEAGHYLLKSKTHAPHGLMRAAWPAEEFLSEDRARFGLAANERAAVRGSFGAPRFRAVAFDSFVLFNPDSIVATAESIFPGHGRELTTSWRTRQFEYSWLRSITGRYTDFFNVTVDALVYACHALGLELTPDNKQRLLDAYLHLMPWPDTANALRRLRAAGVRVIAITNFSPAMLRSNATNAAIVNLFDRLVSTDMNHTFKPDPRAYQLGPNVLHLPAEDIVFAAFGGWDAAGAKAFGYPTVWVNRFNQPIEELGVRPDRIATDLDGLLRFVLEEAYDR